MYKGMHDVRERETERGGEREKKRRREKRSVEMNGSIVYNNSKK